PTTRHVMRYRTSICLLTLLVIAPMAAGQDTRTFPEAECSYTLPGNDWEWLDPGLIKAGVGRGLVFAKSTKGLIFNLQFDPLKENEKVTSNAFESFEVGYLRSGQQKKRGSRRLTFRGVPSYQIDAELAGGQRNAARIMYANNKFYFLLVTNAFGPLGP